MSAKEKIQATTTSIDLQTVSVKDLRKELKALRDLMLNLEEGTEAYNKTLKDAANIQHQLREQTEKINYSAQDFGQIVGNVSKSLAGVTGAFSAATGALSLFGVESENIEKAQKKLTALIAIVQGLSSIDAGVKGFKALAGAIKVATANMNGFKAAMVSTGIGALVIAVGALAANWDKVAKMLGLASDAVERHKQKTEELSAAYSKLKAEQSRYDDQVDYELKVMKIQGATEDEILNKEFNSLKLKRDKIKLDLEERAIIIANNKALIKQWEYVNDRQEERNELIRQNNELIHQQDEQTKNLNKTNKQLYITAYTIQANKKSSGNGKGTASSAKENLDSLLKDIRKSFADQETLIAEEYNQTIANLDKLLKARKITLDEYTDLLTQAYKKMVDAISAIDKECEEKQKQNREQSRQDEINALNLQNADLQQAELQRLANGEINYADYINRLTALDNQYLQDYIEILRKQLEADGITAEERLNIESELNNAMAQLAANNNDKQLEGQEAVITNFTKAIGAAQQALSALGADPAWSNLLARVAELAESWDDLSKKLKGDTKEIAEAAFQISAATTGAIADMMTGIAAEQDISTKEGFERQKKLNIGAAVMNMLAGILSAWSSSMPLGFPMNVIVGSTLSTMMTALGAVQIAKIKKTKFGDSASDTGNSATPSTGSLAKLAAPVQYTSELPDAYTEKQINTKVYVLESDITTTQNRVAVSQAEAMF